MEALTRAMEELSFSWGTTSRSRAMPSGTMPIPIPWRHRPTIMGTTVDDRAHTTEPAISGTAHTSSMRRLPTMSPRRPKTGTQTAPTTSVAVITQAAFDALVSRIFGSSAISGVTSVCMIAAVMPANASVATTPPARAEGLVASMPELLDVWPNSGMHRTCNVAHAFPVFHT